MPAPKLRDEQRSTLAATTVPVQTPLALPTSVPAVAPPVQQSIPRPRTDRSANDKAKCYVCRKTRAEHPSGKWCEKVGKAKDARQNQKQRRAEQQKAQQTAAVKALEGGTALEAMTKVVAVALDDPVAAKEDDLIESDSPIPEDDVPENAPPPATAETKSKVEGRDPTVQSKSFHWFVGDLFALPEVNLFKLCLFTVVLIVSTTVIISHANLPDWALFVNLFYLLIAFVYYVSPRLFFPNWLGTKIPVYSVCTNVRHVDLIAGDLRADNSKMIPVKHENDVWMSKREFIAYVPKVRSWWWERLFLRLPNQPHHFLGSGAWEPIVLDVNKNLRVSHNGWSVDISDTLYRPHEFYVSISQVAQHAQLHFVGGMTREEAVRKLNLLSRNASGVTYDRYSVFKEQGDTLEAARDFSRHVLQDHLLRQNDLPEDFSSAPQH